MDERLRLETPEQIEVNYTIARLGSRFIAALWDTLFIGLLQVMLLMAGAVTLRALDAVGVYAEDWGLAILVLLGFILFWGYYVIFELIWNGQTPGKRLTGIRTVRQNGYPIGFGESAIRNIVRLADLLPAAYGFGVVSMFIDKQSRRLGDFAAGTLVVHERPLVPLQTIRNTAAEDARLLEPRLPHLERLSVDEIEAARRFLQRRATLNNTAALAAQLAARFRERLEVEAEAPGESDNVLLLQRVVAQHGRG